MEDFHTDNSARNGPQNCDFIQAAVNRPTSRESVAKDEEIFFPFPFPPYDIQEDFMKTLYHVLENGGVGIFESPTGTGKSLSLISGSLTWLKDFEGRQQKELENSPASARNVTENCITAESKDPSSTPDWVAEFAEKQAQREAEDRIKEKRERLEEQKSKLQRIKNEIRSSYAVKSGKRKVCLT